MHLRLLACFVASIAFCCSCSRSSQNGAEPDAAIYNELSHIAAIDNHAHPVKVLASGEQDSDVDALPADAISDLALPTPMMDGSPYLPLAWKALFDYTREGTDAKAQSQQLMRRREDLAKSKGNSYPSWVLNQTDTAVMLANRVAMGRGLTSDRFKWVPFADTFLFPLQNRMYKSRDPEHNAFFAREEALLAGYLQAVG